MNAIQVVAPAGGSVERVFAARSAAPFSPERLAFVHELGRAIMRSPEARAMPELVALGFWARPANVQQMIPQANDTGLLRLARGLAFHIAPANVDTIFVYSLLLSVLAGNRNIVRISSKESEQTGLLLRLIQDALEQVGPDTRESLAIVRYEADRAINDYLSARCDLRLVWGGDATIATLRQSPLAPHATELNFPNKLSGAVIDAAGWLALADRDEQARRFSNDALWFGQQACSSPRFIFWRGPEALVQQAAEDFWTRVESAAAKADLPWSPRAAVDKLVAEQLQASRGGTRIRSTMSNRVRVIQARSFETDDCLGAAEGFFVEARIDALHDLLPLVQRLWQTIVSIGVPAADWQAFLSEVRPHGIDRIVPAGAALDFSKVWDGQDLLDAMTRRVDLSRL
jgi:hypothetical protein